MHIPRPLACLLVVALVGASACGGHLSLQGSSPAASTTPGATPATAGAPSAGAPSADTSVTPFEVTDFDAVHRPLDAGGNGALIFGALPIVPAAPGAPAAVAALLGRWVGAGLGPPIKGDWKYVVAITEVTADDGTALVWAGTNVQYPSRVEQAHFRITGSGTTTGLEWRQTIDGVTATVTARLDPETGDLRAVATPEGGGASGEPVVLRRDTATGIVYRDYERHLAGLGITWDPNDDPALAAAGAGSLVYLPPGYADDPSRTWPLVLFLHGSGDRGDNGFILAQNSPFRFVTGGQTLDAIVVAPLLAAGTPYFPTSYLDGVLDDALATYRVDRSRVTVTGLSMGGEAAYRIARHRPATFAGVAVLCGFDAAAFPAAITWGYAPIGDPESGLAGVPLKVIHGRDDTIVPLTAAQATVDALQAAGVTVDFTVLEGHDHDVWTSTYDDPAFYAWLLAQRRPGA